jgi:hypothetical protein
VNNVQLYLAIGLPTIAVLSTLAVNLILTMGLRTDLQQLRAEMGQLCNDINARFRDVDAQFRDLRADIKDLDKRLTRVE